MSPGPFAGLRPILAAAAVFVVLAAPPAAFAGRLIALKPEVSSGPTVTLGDLFDGAGAAGSVVVGNGAPNGESAVLDAGIVRKIAGAHGLEWDNPDAISRIVVPRAAVTGRMIEALTYSHSIQTGDAIQPDDLTYAKIPAFSAPNDAPSDANQIIGKVARRPLRAGAAAARHDVSTPQVIKANDTVNVIYRNDGVNLTLQGKALGAAAVGESVEVMNTASKKVVQAVASGVDEAVVGPDAEALRAQSVAPSQFALR
jgi:flagellar basal body P-ring formation protein FlgA